MTFDLGWPWKVKQTWILGLYIYKESKIKSIVTIQKKFSHLKLHFWHYNFRPFKDIHLTVISRKLIHTYDMDFINIGKVIFLEKVPVRWYWVINRYAKIQEPRISTLKTMFLFHDSFLFYSKLRIWGIEKNYNVKGNFTQDQSRWPSIYQDHLPGQWIWWCMGSDPTWDVSVIVAASSI